jgi:hypothetical protein
VQTKTPRRARFQRSTVVGALTAVVVVLIVVKLKQLLLSVLPSSLRIGPSLLAQSVLLLLGVDESLQHQGILSNPENPGLHSASFKLRR